MSKTVLVTGASKGIGKAIALDAAKAGYTVVVHYGQDALGASDTLKTIEKEGGSGRLITFDISDRAACLKKITADIENFGAYYGVILNAGITRDNAFPALLDDDWDQVLRTNLDGFYNVLKPVVMPMVRAKKPGRIITISSLSGVAGNRGQVNYSASKGGLISATKSLAIELGKRQITVNSVAPGLIDTQMIEKLPIEDIKKIIPLNRIGTVNEVAATVTFLLSEGAAYITRQVINVNGGIA
ncbi:MAG TPA: 3-oxoacyl-ACP reductase FabG [Holosporales bacterium]|nr:3-oxoacyl-ACP reductase FabG [Holosporales bacterium]